MDLASMSGELRRVFLFDDGEASSPLEAMRFIPHSNGEGFLGVFSDVMSTDPARRASDTKSIDLHGRASALQKCLTEPEVQRAAGLLSWDADEIFDECSHLDLHQLTLLVDNEQCNALSGIYRGLELCFGDPFVELPFLMVRKQGGGRTWPSLVSRLIESESGSGSA